MWKCCTGEFCKTSAPSRKHPVVLLAKTRLLFILLLVNVAARGNHSVRLEHFMAKGTPKLVPHWSSSMSNELSRTAQIEPLLCDRESGLSIFSYSFVN